MAGSVLAAPTGGTEWHNSNRYVSLYIFIYLILLTIVFTLSKYLHDRPRLAALLPEAAMIILVGMAAGLAHYISDLDFNAHEEQAADEVVHSILTFSPVHFFIILLPPVIFNGGYHIHRDLFFRYITPICLYAIVGTTVCTLAVAFILYALKSTFAFDVTLLELMAFGALVSATDPVSTLSVFSAKQVDPHLFYLVFGESVINDAVGLVIFEALAHLVNQQLSAEDGEQEELAVSQEIFQFFFEFFVGFVGSLCLGTVFGIVVAFLLKKVDLRHTPVLELCLYMTIIYFPFVTAELLHLSGIVSVLFTGIAAKRYAEPNLSATTAENADTIIRFAAHLAETIIFLELGMSIFGLIGVGAFQVGFIAWALFACLVGRAMNIYPITFLYNFSVSRGRRQASNEKQHLAIELSAQADTNEFSLTNATADGNHDVNHDKTEKETNTIDDSYIAMSKANMLWFSGLRGAVSYGLVRTFPETENKNIFIVTTVVIIILTTFLLGGSTAWALDKLGIPVGVDETEYLQSLRQKRKRSTWIRFFESKTIQKFVIRDFQKNKDTDPTIPTDTNDPEAKTDYHEHVETTEQFHLENITRERRDSIYDFGK